MTDETVPSCKVCALQQDLRDEIEEMIENRESNTEISRLLSVRLGDGHGPSEAAVRRHKTNHMGVMPDEETYADQKFRPEITVTPEGGELCTGALPHRVELAEDWDAVLRGFGLDPTVFVIVDDTVQMSMWQQSKRTEDGHRDVVWLFAYRARFRRRPPQLAPVDVQSLRDNVAKWKPRLRGPRNEDQTPSTFVVCWADLQIGKSASGGVETTIRRIEESYELTVQRLEELRKIRNVERVAVFNMGDPIENCYGQYESQLFSVELTLREQLNLCMDLWVEGIKAIQPDLFASVGCNHGEWTRKKTGGSPITTDSDNAGLYLADTLRRVFDGREGGPSEWVIPHDEMIDLVTLSGIDIGVTHGHKIPSQNKEADWLRSQSIRLLREKGQEPRLWVTAHRHHVRIDDFGPWWRIQCPSLDGGSKYFADATGNWSTPGTMTFLAGQHDPRGFSDLAILGSARSDGAQVITDV